MPKTSLSRTTRALVGAAVAMLGVGCAGVYTPRFPEDVAAALAAEPMSRIETPDIYLYYPSRRRDVALRFLDRVEGCVAYWRSQTWIRNRLAGAKLVLVMPEMPLNNAFVSPRFAGYEDIGVIPTYNTIDFFTLEGGLPPDPAFIGCHEVTHYVHFQQMAGFGEVMNLVLGDLYSPQIGLDAWFSEGLAVYSETILQPGTGRLAWPFWNGVFAAAVAGRRINGGDLSAFNRIFEGGHHYLVGSQFVRFLAERYGEARLWKLIEVQGRSIFFPLWVNVRFWQAYDKSLSTLIDEFADDTAARFPPVPRPIEQRTIREVGSNARYARALDGTEAFITADVDRPSRVQVHAPDGHMILDRALTDVLPPRDLKRSSPSTTGGLSFSSDARQLYFAALDLDVTYQATRLVRLDVATGAITTVSPDLHGSGGSVSPDGRRYLFTRAEGDRHELTELEMETGALRTVAVAAPQHYLTNPRYSPDGRRVVATSFDGQRFGIAVLSASDGRPVAVVPALRGPMVDPAWVDEHRIVFLGSAPASVGFQVYVRDLEAGTTTQVTHAPYLAFNPRATADGKAVRFLNREGWGWTLDEVLLPPARPAPAPPALPPPSSRVGAPGGPRTVSFLVAGGAPPAVDEGSGPPPIAPAPGPAGPTPGVRTDGEVPAPPPPPPFSEVPPPVVAPQPPPAQQWPPPAQPWPPPAPGYPPGTYPPPPGGYAPPGFTPSPGAYPPPPPPPPRLPPPLSPVSLQTAILGERPYAGLDHLFAPQLHALNVRAAGRAGTLYGLVLDGGDRLERHRWLLFSYLQPPPGAAASKIGSGLFSWGGGYSNRQLAPFTLSMTAAQYAWRDVPERPANSPLPTAADFTLQKRRRDAQLSLDRALYGNPIQLSLLVTEDREPDDAAVPVALRRLAGPSLSASYTGVETTPYTDDRRLAHANVSLAYYPRQWATVDFSFADLRGQLLVTLPLPLSRRHTLHLGLRGRALAGVPDARPDARLLQVGGAATGFLFHRSDRPSAPDFSSDLTPPGISFFEPLRGYEDFALATTRVAIGDASYRYPVIIDRGSASTLGVLPAFYLRQLNLELFFSGAIEGRARARHAAAGGAVGVDFALLLPWALQYQLAQRLEDDRARVHALLLGLGW